MLFNPIQVGLNLGQLAGRGNDENRAQTACPIQIYKMIALEEQNLYVCISGIAEFACFVCIGEVVLLLRYLHCKPLI